MVHIQRNKKLNELSIDDFEAYLFTISDVLGYLQPSQMLMFELVVNTPLHVTDFLDLFHYSRLKL